MTECSETAAVGIDLGTTYSLVAWVDASGHPATVINSEGDLTTPSVVFFDRQGVIVGKEAIKAAEFEPERVAQFAKRDMGRVAFHKSIRGEPLPPEVIQALVLRKLRADAELRLGDVHRAVITVPAYFDEPRRKATEDAGRLAGLEVLDILNEPTAAAISYGVQQGFIRLDGAPAERETVLVYDLGGGTFDVTLMEIDGRNFNALATAGDVYLGGIDWTERIVDFVGEQFMTQFDVDPRIDECSLQHLISEAEDAKRALTAREEVNLMFAYEGHRLRTSLTRQKFEELTGDLTDRTILTVRKVLREAKLEWKDVTRLLLVGGSSRMPAVQRVLEEESGRQVDRSLSPDEAVGHGAAIYAALLAGHKTDGIRDIAIQNVNSHDLGVLGKETATGRNRRQIMIPRNTPLPCKSRSDFKTFRDNQPSVAVEIIEGGDASGNNATRIGRCVVSGLPPHLPAKTPVEVTFRYSTSGRISVSAFLPSVDKHAELTIERASGLPAEQFSYWQGRILEGLTDAALNAAKPEAETSSAETKPAETKPAETADAASVSWNSAKSAEAAAYQTPETQRTEPEDAPASAVITRQVEPPVVVEAARHLHEAAEADETTSEKERTAPQSATPAAIEATAVRPVAPATVEVVPLAAAEDDSPSSAPSVAEMKTAAIDDVVAGEAQTPSANSPQLSPAANANAVDASDVPEEPDTVSDEYDDGQSDELNDEGELDSDNDVVADVAPPELKVAEEDDPQLVAAEQHKARMRTIKVMAINTGIHALLLLILAAIVLPGSPIAETFSLVSSPSDEIPEDDTLQEMIEKPETLEEQPQMEVVTDVITEKQEDFTIDVNSLAPSMTAVELDDGGNSAAAPITGEMGGRSQAGRQTLLTRYGGTDASEAAVGRGLSWLKQHQQPGGFWSFDHRTPQCDETCSQPGSMARSNMGATAMALLAYMGSGSTYTDGEYQQTIENGLNYLINRGKLTQTGLDLRGDYEGNSGMYIQGIATICLAEAAAMNEAAISAARPTERMIGIKNRRVVVDDTKKLKAAAQAAIAFISNAQHPAGGWRYKPGEAGDTSVVGWQIMGLVSGRSAKIPVSPLVFIRASRFLDSVAADGGAFYGYNSPVNKDSTTAIGLLCRMYMGWDRNNPALKRGIEFLSQTGPAKANMYYNYYATQVLHHYGGDEWTKWNDVMREQLVKTQVLKGHGAGSWNVADQHGGPGGRLYMTCLATMTLEVYYRHLPLYDELEKKSVAAK
ncbi:Hsp70 family protein [bacterium]|nr:Hsp70 family protein [bacterium]